MTSLHLFLLPLLVFSTSSSATRSCSSSLSSLWLDVVLIFDTSITESQLEDVKSLSVSVFGSSRIGNKYQDPRSTRIGVIHGGVVADLDAIDSTDKFKEIIGALTSKNSEKFDALGAAQTMLKVGRANGERESYQQLVVLFGASMEQRKRAEDSKMSIATVSEKTTASELADIVLAANCYCPSGWVQVQAKYKDPNSQKYGSCLKPVNSQLSWSAAKLACQNMIKNGFLVSEDSAEKHDFSAGLAQDTFPGMISYHIGLTFVNGGWYWQQPEHNSLVKLGAYNAWYTNYPRSYVSETGVYGTSNAMGVVSWMNINPNYEPATYMCEVAACDASNHC